MKKKVASVLVVAALVSLPLLAKPRDAREKEPPVIRTIKRVLQVVGLDDLPLPPRP